MFTYFDANLLAVTDETVVRPRGHVECVEDEVFLGILDGVPSSLASDSVEPWRECGLLVGRDVLGVRLLLTGIDVLDGVNKVLDGVRRPRLTESD